jgi:hypothetical protein
MLDKALKLVGEEENIPTFYDMLGKLEFEANLKHSIAAYALLAGDRTAIRDIGDAGTEKHDTKYRNAYFWVGWKAAITERAFVRTLIYSGKIKHNRNAFTQKDEWSDKLIFDLKDKRSYSFEGLKQDWTVDISDKFILKSGLNVRKLRTNYDYRSSLLDLRANSAELVVPYSNSVDEELQPDGEQAGVYISAKTQVSSKLFFETGLRHDYTSYSNDNLVSPRFGFGYAFSARSFLRGAWGHYYQPQFINNLDVSHEITDFDRAELSEHYVLGLEHNFSNGINVRVEGYFKDISRLSPNYQNILDPWELFPEARNDQIRIEYDGASSRGIEFFLKSDLGSKISWWFSYALAKSEENVTNIDFDGLLDARTGTLPRPNNQRHTVYLDFNYRPSDKWKFNISWQFYQGLPQTIYEYAFQAINGENGSVLPLHFYSRHLEFRGLEYPAYHRMDWRINRNYQFERSRMNIFLQIINVYNRENLRKFDLDVQASGGGLISDGAGGYIYPRDDDSWFGIIPVIGMSWEF